MRVLVMTQHFAPEENAPAFRWSWLAEEFHRLGIQVDVVTSAWQDKPTSERAPGGKLNIHRVRNVLSGTGLGSRLINELLVALKSVMRATQLQRPDVVIVTAPPLGAMLYARPLAWLLRCPLALEVRDVWPELLDEWPTWSDYGNGPKPNFARDLGVRCLTFLMKPWLIKARRRATLVVTTTESFAQYLQDKGHPNVICVRNAAKDVPRLAPREFDGTLRVLYMGNVGRSQMLATAVRAAKLVEDAGGSIRLRIVGHGAHLTALQRLVEQLGAPVEFLPNVPHSQVTEQYEWADSLLVMLRDWDAMAMTVPSKLYELLRTGRHVTASVCGEAKDLVEQSNTGDVVPPQDPEALAQLWLDLIASPDRLRTTPDLPAAVTAAEPRILGERYATVLQSLIERNT